MPRWVQEGFHEYQKRISREFGFSSIEVPLARRTRTHTVQQCLDKEGELLLARIKPDDYVIAFEVGGKSIDTAELAQRLQDFRQAGQNPVFLIGGPDGLAASCLGRADECWSLSALTLPHPLVRILVAEQIYRASTLLAGHPYHRE